MQNKDNHQKRAINNFYYILNKYIKQFFPSGINFEIKTVGNKKVLKKHVIKYKNKILFYPCLESPRIYAVLSIDYNYKVASIDIIEYVLQELMNVSPYTYDNEFYNEKRVYGSGAAFARFYLDAAYNTAFEVAVCRHMCKGNDDKNNRTTKTLIDLLFKLNTWTTKTYEGNKVPFGFIIDCNVRDAESYNYIDFLDNHSSAVFTDGVYGGILLDVKGNFIKYFSYEDSEQRQIEKDKTKPISPLNYIMFTENCCNKKIGMLCLTNGDILLIKNKKLLFSKRNGNWIYYDYNRFRHETAKYIHTDIYDKDNYLTNFIDQIYLTVLDVSFSHTGGCLAITNYDRFDEYKEAIEKDLLDIDLLDDDNDDEELKAQKSKIRQRKKVIRNLLGAHPFSKTYKEFYNITRKLRQELLGLDGATIVNTNGKLLAAGAIVSIDGGSENGGRTAAAKQLAKYGFAIKISEDGYIQCYGYNNDTKKVENFLNFC